MNPFVDLRNTACKRGSAVLLLLMLAPQLAWAYIDPGSGLVLWQGLIALIGAIMLVVRHPVRSAKRLLDYLRRRFKR